MKQRSFLLLAVLGLFVLPQHASANAGTPLIWARLLHLTVGNLFIGVFEGLLLGWLFAALRSKAVGMMVLANYLSAWAGAFLIGGVMADVLPMDLNNGWKWFWIMVAVTYFLTLLLEWPFVAFVFLGTRDWWKRSLRASLVVQSCSYLLLFGWYWLASGTSLYTQMQVVPPAELALPENVLVHFIDPADGNVYRRDLAGREAAQKIYELNSTDANDRLFVRPNEADPILWDLMARLETGDYEHPRFVEIRAGMLVDAAPDPRSLSFDPPYPPQYASTYWNFGEVPALGSGTQSRWKFWAGSYAMEGLRGSEASTGRKVHFSYETQFGAWRVRNAVLLPGDKVLFQFGRDQICGFDPVERRVALLWHGRGPVPVIERKSHEGE